MYAVAPRGSHRQGYVPLRRTALCLFLLSTSAFAEDIPWYTVEMLIFAYADPAATEHWPLDPGFPDLSDAIQLSEASPTESTAQRRKIPTPYQRLADEQLTLAAARKKIDASRNYQLLLHTAWRQQGLDKTASKPVFIRSGKYPLPPPPRLQPSAAQLHELAVVPSVEGTVRMYRTRYLHFEVDLRYFRPNPDAESSGDFLDEDVYLTERTIPPTHFRLTESRRMRSRELHYLDQPLFGVLVQVNPYEVSSE